jgi:hypothetical protein
MSAQMGRPKHLNPRVEVKIRLKPETLGYLNLLSIDPLTTRLKYSLRNEHIEQALREFYDKHYPRKKQAVPSTN